MKETRIKDANTGGEKGSKLAKFSAIPPDVLWELAEHFGKGNAKYPDPSPGLQNWMRTYDWNLSIDALSRHWNLFLLGEELDSHNGECTPECVDHTGSPHLIAVAWHAFVLRYWSKHNRAMDNRYFSTANKVTEPDDHKLHMSLYDEYVR